MDDRGVTMFKLMIVDDELLMRIGIRSMIDWEEHGFRIVGEAANGKEALDIAIDALPDLIITDIKMPIMDGLQLIREASSTLAGCKYVILSNFDEFRYVKEALQLGALDYLIKTEVTPAALTALLSDIRRKLLVSSGGPASLFALPPDYSQSVTHLKEILFKDAISGLLNVEEIRGERRKAAAIFHSEHSRRSHPVEMAERARHRKLR
jgi:two-component system response regulator YesN